MSALSLLRRLDRKAADKLRSTNSVLVLLVPVLVFVVVLALLVLTLALIGRLGPALHGCIDRGPGLPCSPAVGWNLGWPSAVAALASFGYLWKRGLPPQARPKPTHTAADGPGPVGDEVRPAAREGEVLGEAPKSAGQAFAIDIEALPGLADRVVREGLLGTFALSTGSFSSYGIVLSDRGTGHEVGRLSSGSDYATAIGFRDILRERADEMTPAEFFTVYRLDPPAHPAPHRSPHVNAWSEVEKSRVRTVLVPVYASLVVAAVAVIWLMR
jgi:hypothetical protein